MIITRETYEQGTGKLLETKQIEVPDQLLSKPDKLINLMVKKGLLTKGEADEVDSG